MKAVVVTAPDQIAVVDDIPVPRIAEYECLARITATGLCNATDLKIIHGQVSRMATPFPAVLGHESVGEIVEVGPKVRNIRVGDVFTNPSGRIDPASGYNRMWGCMAEFGVVRDVAVMREMGLDATAGATCATPREIPPADAACLLTLKEAYSALENFGFRPGMDVLIFGDGPVGLALAKFLRLRDAGWVGCTGHHADRLAKVAEIGDADRVINTHDEDLDAAMGDRKVDLVIDAVGSVELVRAGAKFCRPGGKVGIYGVLKSSASQIDLLAELPNNVAVHVLCFPHGEHDVHETLCRLVRDGRLDISAFYSHVLPMDQAPRGVELITRREAYKVIFQP